MPGLSKDVKVAKDLGKASMVHICGDITDRLDLIADSGVDCISLDYKVNLIKARELVGNRVSLAGNVNPVNVLQFGNNDDVRCAAESCLKDGAENGSFILLPGCDIASGVTASNLRVFVETAHNWKG
jgi:uroporphyrinogen decarboxylase